MGSTEVGVRSLQPHLPLHHVWEMHPWPPEEGTMAWAASEETGEELKNVYRAEEPKFIPILI